MLAETGDDRSRFQDAKGLKAYAGAAPITRASGKTRSVTRRHVKNNRLNAAGYTWVFSAISASPGARARYYCRRDAGDRHAGALRNLFGRLLSGLHHCLATGQHYDEATAFPAHKTAQLDSKIWRPATSVDSDHTRITGHRRNPDGDEVPEVRRRL